MTNHTESTCRRRKQTNTTNKINKTEYNQNFRKTFNEPSTSKPSFENMKTNEKMNEKPTGNKNYSSYKKTNGNGNTYSNNNNQNIKTLKNEIEDTETELTVKEILDSDDDETPSYQINNLQFKKSDQIKTITIKFFIKENEIFIKIPTNISD